jgi:hypothetical protein
MKQNDAMLELLTQDEYDYLMSIDRTSIHLMDTVIIEDDNTDETYVMVERLG